MSSLYVKCSQILNTSAPLSGKHVPVPIGQTTGWTPELLSKLRRRDRILSVLGIEPELLSHPARNLLSAQTRGGQLDELRGPQFRRQFRQEPRISKITFCFPFDGLFFYVLG